VIILKRRAENFTDPADDQNQPHAVCQRELAEKNLDHTPDHGRHSIVPRSLFVKIRRQLDGDGVTDFVIAQEAFEILDLVGEDFQSHGQRLKIALLDLPSSKTLQPCDLMA
jgi:hypothetical protein